MDGDIHGGTSGFLKLFETKVIHAQIATSDNAAI